MSSVKRCAVAKTKQCAALFAVSATAVCPPLSRGVLVSGHVGTRHSSLVVQLFSAFTRSFFLMWIGLHCSQKGAQQSFSLSFSPVCQGEKTEETDSVQTASQRQQNLNLSGPSSSLVPVIKADKHRWRSSVTFESDSAFQSLSNIPRSGVPFHPDRLVGVSPSGQQWPPL